MLKKINNILITMVFFAAIILPAVFSDKTGGKISVMENRVLAPFPTFFSADSKLVVPGLRSGIENWIKDNAGFRVQIKKILANIDFRVFKVSPSSLVQIGEDGFYFYTLNNNLEIAMGTFTLSIEDLEKLKENQIIIQQALREKGIEYVIVLVPGKPSVYPEKIVGNYVVRETLIDTAADYLQKNTTIPVINLKPALLEAKKSGIVYLKRNTHWNPVGTYVGYQTIINTLNDLGMIQSTPVETSRIEFACESDMARLLGDTSLLPPEPCEMTVIPSPKAIKLESGEHFQKMQEFLKPGQDPFQAPRSFENPAVEQKRLLMYGDSMTSVIMPELLAENFSSLDWIWDYKIKNEQIEQVKPDIVILEVAERFISGLPSPDPERLFEPIKDPQAEILSHNIPSQMMSGKKFDLEITVKNSGSETWKNFDQIRLIIFQDGSDVGMRGYLPDGMEVKPGEAYTFIIRDYRAPNQITTVLACQMVVEGVALFGEKESIEVMIK